MTYIRRKGFQSYAFGLSQCVVSKLQVTQVKGDQLWLLWIVWEPLELDLDYLWLPYL